ncbi:MAG: ribose-phosphate pyrophosphokinase [Candidatus Sumerlaeia bacterium]|nr:ribose-phosphate pyrophosphokinase [Candidatus Sumerlaeia bacterium]
MADYVNPPLIIPGSASRELAQSVSRHLIGQLGGLDVRTFSDGETFVKVLDNVRGRDVFVIQATQSPTNDHLMVLLLTLDALKRASADRVTAVIPYFGYARQDRKDQGRVALSAKLVANLITTAGADRVLAIDLHAGQLQGFFDIPVDHLIAGPLLIQYVRDRGLTSGCVVSPDVGNVKLSRDYANKLQMPLAIIDKHRPQANVSEVRAIIGVTNIQGRDVLLFDDMIDTAGTICHAAEALRAEGAKEVYAIATHGVLSGPAIERLVASPIKEVVITNTIQHPAGTLPDKIKVLDVAPLLAKAIDRIHRHSSVSALFRDI